MEFKHSGVFLSQNQQARTEYNIVYVDYIGRYRLIVIFLSLYARMRARCGASCTSSSSMMGEEGYNCPNPTTPQNTLSTLHPPGMGGMPPGQPLQEGGGITQSFTTRGSLVSTASSASKPSSAFVSLAGLIADTSSVKECVQQRVRVSCQCDIVLCNPFL